ncbi:MAG: thioredoxin family protein [Muribaculaceae bacterium]|nr:thioredoxin family protein [Muribaculaceae bacterium]
METDKIKALEKETGVVLVEFYATWCPHCRKMMPVVDDVKALFEGRAAVYQFDIDLNGEFADTLEVKSIPTFSIFKNGEEVWRTAGETEADLLARKLEEALQS